MRPSLLAPFLLAALSTALPDSSTAHPPPPGKCAKYLSGVTARDAFATFVDLLYNRGAYASLRPWLNPGYIDHGQYERDGADALIGALERFNLTAVIDGFQATVPPCGANRQAVVYYRARVPGWPLAASMDLFRMDGPCVAERWGTTQLLAANATSPHPFFNGRLTEKAVVPQCAGGY